MSNYEDINYKKMYESSQASLSDMASKHAETLSRIGRIRGSISLILKRNFPNLFSYAEKHSNARISDLDDEIILAYLETFIKSGSESVNSLNLDGVRDALNKLGLNFQGTTISSLISFLDELSRQGFKISNINDSIKQTSETKHPKAEKNEEFEELESAILIQNIFDDLTDTERWSPPPINNILNNSGIKPSHNELADLEKVVNTKISGPEYTPPLKPEIIKQPNLRGRRGKQIKVQATRPEKPLFEFNENSMNDSNESKNNPLSDEIMDKLIVSSALNKPMFIRDLATVAGSRDDADKWEEICRLQPALYPVRFIGAKVRHKNRGSLVVPATSIRVVGESLNSNWWWSAVDLYRGSKLYELGVLLNRYGSKLINYSYLNDYSILNINDKDDSKIILVVLYGTNALNDQSLIDKIFKQITNESPNIIFFLQTQSEDSAIEKTISKLKFHKDQLKWRSNCDVKVGYSWEFAEDRGSSSINL